MHGSSVRRREAHPRQALRNNGTINRIDAARVPGLRLAREGVEKLAGKMRKQVETDDGGYRWPREGEDRESEKRCRTRNEGDSCTV